MVDVPVILHKDGQGCTNTSAQNLKLSGAMDYPGLCQKLVRSNASYTGLSEIIEASLHMCIQLLVKPSKHVCIHTPQQHVEVTCFEMHDTLIERHNGFMEIGAHSEQHRPYPPTHIYTCT